MSDRGDLGRVLADAREEAAILKAHGHVAQAKSVEALADRVAAVMRPYLTTLSEKEASLRSGWSPSKLRNRFAEWESQGFAALDGKGKRRYRQIIVPARVGQDAARLAGERGESLKGA